jgi:hypothetical protein
MVTVDDLDRILGGEESLVPSAGFAQRVMEAVRQSLEYVTPLCFPWWRFVAGLSLGLLCALVSAAVLLHFDLVSHTLSALRGAIPTADSVLHAEVATAVLTLLGTLLAIFFAVEWSNE